VQADSAGVAHRLFLSDDEIRWSPTGHLEVRTARQTPGVLAYDQASRTFRDLALEPATGPARQADVAVTRTRAASDTAAMNTAAVASGYDYGSYDGRPSAPTAGILDAHSAVYTLDVGDLVDLGDSFLHIDWAGDVGRLLLDGRVVTDRFWDGSSWIVNLADAGFRAGSAVQLSILPLSVDSVVALPADAARRLAASDGPLASVDAVRVVSMALWTEIG
jgi:beta-galactosidase